MSASPAANSVSRARVTAYNIKDGKLVVGGLFGGPRQRDPDRPDKTTALGKPVGKDSSLKTWQGDQWKIGGGGTWGWISYDPELNLVYYGSGNPSTWNPEQRPGDNKWSMTIFARNPDTGMAKWVYQMTPHDQWDYDGVNEMILADIDDRRAADQGARAFRPQRSSATPSIVRPGRCSSPKSMTPRSTGHGRHMKEHRRTTAVRRSLPSIRPGHQGRGCKQQKHLPGGLGSKDQQPAAFSPKTGLFYVPTNHVCMDYEPFKVSYTAGQPYVGATLSMYPPQGDNNMGNFIAWDASTGKIVWSDPEQFSVWSGALATAGNVVFYGTLEGYLKAVDARPERNSTGSKLRPGSSATS